MVDKDKLVQQILLQNASTRLPSMLTQLEFGLKSWSRRWPRSEVIGRRKSSGIEALGSLSLIEDDRYCLVPGRVPLIGRLVFFNFHMSVFEVFSSISWVIP